MPLAPSRKPRSSKRPRHRVRELVRLGKSQPPNERALSSSVNLHVAADASELYCDQIGANRVGCGTVSWLEPNLGDRCKSIIAIINHTFAARTELNDLGERIFCGAAQGILKAK